MKKIWNGILVIAVAVLVVSCTIEDKIVFNEDFSGRYSVRVDMGEMVKTMDAMMAGMKEGFEGLADSTMVIEEEPDTAEDLNFGEGFMGGMAKGMKDITAQVDSLQSVWKVNNLEFEVDSVNFVTNLSFDFPNLKSLSVYMKAFSESMNEGAEGSSKSSNKTDGNVQLIYLKGNKLIFKGDSSKSKQSKEEQEMEEMMMPMMNQSITISNEYVFPKNIKSTNHPFAVINGKTAKITYNLQQMMDEKLGEKDIYFEF
jgi:hypothetical protein